jgi:hypothetical protein
LLLLKRGPEGGIQLQHDAVFAEGPAAPVRPPEVHLVKARKWQARKLAARTGARRDTASGRVTIISGGSDMDPPE